MSTPLSNSPSSSNSVPPVQPLFTYKQSPENPAVGIIKVGDKEFTVRALRGGQQIDVSKSDEMAKLVGEFLKRKDVFKDINKIEKIRITKDQTQVTETKQAEKLPIIHTAADKAEFLSMVDKINEFAKQTLGTKQVVVSPPTSKTPLSATLASSSTTAAPKTPIRQTGMKKAPPLLSEFSIPSRTPTPPTPISGSSTPPLSESSSEEDKHESPLAGVSPLPEQFSNKMPTMARPIPISGNGVRKSSEKSSASSSLAASSAAAAPGKTKKSQGWFGSRLFSGIFGKSIEHAKTPLLQKNEGDWEYETGIDLELESSQVSTSGDLAFVIEPYYPTSTKTAEAVKPAVPKKPFSIPVNAINVPANGNCFFYSMAVGLYKQSEEMRKEFREKFGWTIDPEELTGGMTENLSLFNGVEDYLRQEAAKYLEEHVNNPETEVDNEFLIAFNEDIREENKAMAPDLETLNFLKIELEKNGKILQVVSNETNKIAFDLAKTNYHNQLARIEREEENLFNNKSYIEHIKKSNSYSGNAMIMALAYRFNVPIQIVHTVYHFSEPPFNKDAPGNPITIIACNAPKDLSKVESNKEDHFMYQLEK